MEKKINVTEVNSAFWDGLFPAGCLVTSIYPKFSIISANDEMARMMGYKDANEVKKASSGSMLDFVYPDDRQRTHYSYIHGYYGKEGDILFIQGPHR